VVGGVVGGVVGSTGPPAPVDPPKFLPPNVGKSQLAIDPQSDQFRPRLPPILNKPGMRFMAMVKICVNKDGNVTEVTLVKKADPLLDSEIVAKVRSWKYTPLTVEGRAVPFCTTFPFVIVSQAS
jgi:TonB family protein